MAEEDSTRERRRGRPRGLSARGAETRHRLYTTAIRLIATRGWHETTLRDIAAEAGVSVGLLYRYFPSKRAVVLALYDDLSAEYAARAATMEVGRWRERCLYALRASLDVLRPHRRTLSALVPVLVSTAEDGLFAPGTAFSRLRVQRVFEQAVVGASDAPRPELAAALGRLLYLIHLATILWWLLDKTPGQWATDRLITLLERALPLVALSLRMRRLRELVIDSDTLVGAALLDGIAAPREREG